LSEDDPSYQETSGFKRVELEKERKRITHQVLADVLNLCIPIWQKRWVWNIRPYIPR